MKFHTYKIDKFFKSLKVCVLCNLTKVGFEHSQCVAFRRRQQTEATNGVRMNQIQIQSILNVTSQSYLPVSQCNQSISDWCWSYLNSSFTLRSSMFASNHGYEIGQQPCSSNGPSGQWCSQLLGNELGFQRLSTSLGKNARLHLLIPYIGSLPVCISSFSKENIIHK